MAISQNHTAALITSCEELKDQVWGKHHKTFHVIVINERLPCTCFENIATHVASPDGAHDARPAVFLWRIDNCQFGLFVCAFMSLSLIRVVYTHVSFAVYTDLQQLMINA